MDLGWARTNPCFDLKQALSDMMTGSFSRDTLLIGVCPPRNIRYKLGCYHKYFLDWGIHHL